MALDRPINSADVDLQRVGQEAILYDRRRGRAHVINDSAVRIWTLCDGRATVEEIVRAFAASYAMPPADVHDDVRRIITAFRESGVIA
jgi:PqqD family protein of HPr-rel-A system